MKPIMPSRLRLSLTVLFVAAGLISVQAQITIPASFAAPPGSVNTNAPGFRARVNQMSAPRPGTDQNRAFLAEQQLAGGFLDPNTNLPYPNDADLTLAGLDGFFVITNVINWTQEISPIGTGVEIGLFQSTSTPPAPDEGIPGIPGTTSSTDNIAVEVLTFLELKAGTNQFGVNSDDGFKVTVGSDARDAFATVLGIFDTGRGVAETAFSFVVPVDGIYPFRLLWWEGGGDANVEWYSISGTNRILINDRSNPAAIKAYRESTILSRPYVRSADPAPNAVNVTNSPIVNIVIVDGTSASLTVPTNSIRLFFNDQQVNPTITKPAGTNLTTVSYKPPGTLGPESRNSVRLIYGDNATPQTLVTNEWTFVTQPTTIVVFAIDDRTMWRYDRTGRDLGTAWREVNYDDSAWPEGAALIADETGATAEPIRTPIMRFNDDNVYVPGFYFRTRFVLTNSPGAVRLSLRHVVDDGAIFYVNGVEVHRFGYAAGVTVLFNDSGAAGHENAYEGPFTISAASLVQGTNVFAAEVHQSGTGSSDVVFGAELSVITSNPLKTSVASTVPANGAINVLVTTNIVITLLDGVQQVQTNSIQMTFNGQAVLPAVSKPTGSTTTTVTYDPPGDMAPNTTNTVSLSYQDNATPPNLTTTNFSFLTRPNAVLIFAINDTQMWSYENTGQNLGTAWVAKNYDDSAWPKGPALLALETGTTPEPIRTTLSRTDPSGANIITDYFRTHFNFTGDPATSQLAIRHVVDDGFVLYLNGNEIYRFGLAAGTAVTSATLFGGHENTYEGSFVIPATGLVQGDNVLAAEVHQSDATSSDIVFGLEVSAVIPGGTQPTPRVTSATISGGTITIQWTGGGTLESAPSLSGQWTSTNDSDGSFSEAATGAGKYYRVRR